MEEKKLMWKRRFTGFMGEVEGKRLEEVLEIENGYAFQSKHFRAEATGKVVLTPGNVEVGGGFQNGKGHNYSGSATIPQKFILESDDIFVTMTDLTPSAQTLGFPAMVPNDDNVYLHNQRLGKLVNFNGDKNFLFQLLCTESYHKQVVMTASGTTVKHSSPEMILKCIMSIPCIKEQQKIGNFFKVLDERIANQERKIAKVKALKSAYLTEMFPQEGETVPKRRFKGFEGEWGNESFSELAEIVRGASPRPIENPKWFDIHSNIGWLRISDVTSQNGRITYLEQRLSILGQKKTRVIKDSHLLLSIAATVGKPVINYVETGVHDGFLIFLNPKFDIEYMYQWLVMFREEWQKYGQPGSQINLNSDIIKQHIITIPTIREQQKIGTFFKNLDDQITTEESKLEKLKRMKQAYLEEMFV